MREREGEVPWLFKYREFFYRLAQNSKFLSAGACDVANGGFAQPG